MRRMLPATPARRSLLVAAAAALLPFAITAQTAVTPPDSVFGYKDFAAQAKIDQTFLAVPDAKLAGEELKTLTAAPHIAASKEDYATAEYVAGKFKAAGLETTIVPYKVWLNLPVESKIVATTADGKQLMTGRLSHTL
ncbi:hypothetical protein [Silvibacterium sp.]|uniref:hypothetical protein n=1 Tax=Silvibacterium sp. TaxID=1964179 RepID=UPI0039E539FD